MVHMLCTLYIPVDSRPEFIRAAENLQRVFLHELAINLQYSNWLNRILIETQLFNIYTVISSSMLAVGNIIFECLRILSDSFFLINSAIRLAVHTLS